MKQKVLEQDKVIIDQIANIAVVVRRGGLKMIGRQRERNAYWNDVQSEVTLDDLFSE